MSGEAARVEVKTQGQDEMVWNVVYVNGFEIPHRQRVKTIEQAGELEYDLRRIVEDAFRLGYRHGYGSSQKVIRDALGIR
jgi:hypothetical protein